MAYVPQETGDFFPGLLGDAAAWQGVVDNDLEVFAAYAPQVVASRAEGQTTSATFVTLFQWDLPGNADNEDLAVVIRWKSDGVNTATAQVTVDGTDTATATTTSGSWTITTITVTPTTAAGATPRVVSLELKVAGGGTALIDSVCCALAPGAPAAGELASGYARADAAWYATGAPIDSGRVSRLWNNVRAIARDRPACIVGLLDDVTSQTSRAVWQTADEDLVWRFLWPPSDPTVRDFRFSVYLTADGTAVPEVRMQFGPYTVTKTGTGWHRFTVEADPLMLAGSLCRVTLAVSSGTGNAYLKTLQMFREPSA